MITSLTLGISRREIAQLLGKTEAAVRQLTDSGRVLRPHSRHLVYDRGTRFGL
jgi:hypothetical protein